jgi:hypothetical protein
MAHEGDKVSKITKRETIEGELGRFVLNKGEELHAIVISWPLGWDILAQGLIELIVYSHQQGASSFSEVYLERTFKLSVLGLEQFGMDDRPGSFLGCA